MLSSPNTMLPKLTPGARFFRDVRSKRLDLHRTYRLTVSGTGTTALIDAQGKALDGKGSGRPGSNYVTTVTIANRVSTVIALSPL